MVERMEQVRREREGEREREREWVEREREQHQPPKRRTRNRWDCPQTPGLTTTGTLSKDDKSKYFDSS